MMWDRTKNAVLEVGGKAVTFEIKVPSALDMEEIVSTIGEDGKPAIKDSEIVKKFLLRIDGFNSVDDFLSSPAAFVAMKLIAGFIIESATLKVELKN